MDSPNTISSISALAALWLYVTRMMLAFFWRVATRDTEHIVITRTRKGKVASVLFQGACGKLDLRFNTRASGRFPSISRLSMCRTSKGAPASSSTETTSSATSPRHEGASSPPVARETPSQRSDAPRFSSNEYLAALL